MKLIIATAAVALALAPLAANAQGTKADTNQQIAAQQHRDHARAGHQFDATTGFSPYSHQFVSTDGSGR